MGKGAYFIARLSVAGEEEEEEEKKRIRLHTWKGKKETCIIFRDLGVTFAKFGITIQQHASFISFLYFYFYFFLIPT